MYKTTINCQSCEVKCDVIVRQTNFEDEIDVIYCPVCSANVEDNLDLNIEDDEEWPVSGI